MRDYLIAVLMLIAPASATTPTAEHDRLRAEFDGAMSAYDAAIAVRETHPDQARLMFRAAAQRLSSIAAAGIDNGRLEYNLGNCYLQAGDLGRAILHYRRAKRLIPRDFLLIDNLREARSRRITNIEQTRRSAVLRSVFFWHYDTTRGSRLVTALIVYVAFWVLLAARVLARRRWLTVSACTCVVLCAIIAASVGMGVWQDRTAPGGVVTAMDVVVSKGPGPGYQRQFEQPLQPGVEFTLRERRSDWWRIELPDGKTGWIEAAAADLIVGNTL